MKKLLVVLSLIMSSFSFQASAASMTLVNFNPHQREFFHGDNVVTVSSKVIGGNKGNFKSTWNFVTKEDLTGEFRITLGDLARDFTANLWVNGVHALTKVSDTLDIVFSWKFLKDDHNKITVTGQLGKQQMSDLDIRVSSVPVPAAVWLFGSALMGLMGLSRSKKTLVA